MLPVIAAVVARWCLPAERAPSKRPQAGANGPTALGLVACLDAVADGVVIGDVQGNVTYWNPAALTLHGYQLTEQPRWHLSEFTDTFRLVATDGEGVPFDQWPFARLVRGEAVHGFEAVLTRSDTGQSWVLRYDGAVVSDSRGGPPQIVMTIRDLTEQRRAEHDLRLSRSHFQELLESLPQLVWTGRGEDGACDYVGPQFVRYAGVPRERLLGFGWLGQVHPADREAAGAGWRRALADHHGYEAECRLRRADGAYRWFKVRSVPTRDGSGRVSKWFGTNTDVHDARLATESRAVLAAIVENSDDAIVGTSLDGTIASWNRAAQRMYGYPGDEAIGRNIVMLLPPDRVHEEGDILARVANGEAVQHFESRRVARDGRVLDVSLTISPIRDPSGRVVGASKIARDITARRAAERDLHASHTLLRTLVEGIGDPVYVKDRQGRYLLGNAALGQVVGVPVAEMIGLTEEEVLGESRASDPQTAAVDSAVTFEESRTVGDDVRHYLTTKAPYHDVDGQVAGVLGILRDVTSLKRAERAVAASAQHLRGVLDGLLVYVAVVHPGGRLTGMNLALRQALASRGVAAEAIEGEPLFDRPLPGVGLHVRDQLREAVARAATGEAVRLAAVPLVGGPEPVVLDLMLAPMRGPDGGVTHLIVSAVDVTERERAAQEARERQTSLAHLERVRTMGQMATGLAHELNQPFGAIANYAAACRRMLASDRLPAARLGRALRDIEAEAVRAGAIVQRLRRFVQKQHPQVSTVGVNGVVEDALQMLAYDLRQAGVDVRATFAGGLAPVSADAVQIGQVLVNLIRNALDAMAGMEPERRVLAVETAATDHGVRVSVRDRGCGIPPAVLGQVFDAFFTTKRDGLGIGLALCRTIVEEHGGLLSAEPDPAGGTTFAFTLRSAARAEQ
jgi:PAS domain S-box-containing protein